jgi:SnoaL-like domain
MASTPGGVETGPVVEGAVARLGACLRERDVTAALGCFVSDGALYGDDVGEHAHGAEEMEWFFAELFEEDFTLAWEVQETWARHRGDLVWFVCGAQVVVRSDEGWEDRAPFQVSGVLRATGAGWRFELFNASQPARRTGTLLAG